MAFSRCSWKEVAIVALAVATVVVAVTVPTLLCHRGGGQDRNSLEAPDVTNRSLAEARGRWQRCREELGELQGKILELELELGLANVTRLEERNPALVAELARQREQLGQEQSLRAQLQRQNRLLQEQLRDAQSQRSAGDGLPVFPGVPVLLLLLLLGMLLP